MMSVFELTERDVSCRRCAARMPSQQDARGSSNYSTTTTHQPLLHTVQVCNLALPWLRQPTAGCSSG